MISGWGPFHFPWTSLPLSTCVSSPPQSLPSYALVQQFVLAPVSLVVALWQWHRAAINHSLGWALGHLVWRLATKNYHLHLEETCLKASMSGAAEDLRHVVPSLSYPCLTVLGVAVVWLILVLWSGHPSEGCPWAPGSWTCSHWLSKAITAAHI